MEENKQIDKLPANRKWEQKNKEKTRIDGYRRTARLFINKHSSLDDLEELEILISERKKNIEKFIKDPLTLYLKQGGATKPPILIPILSSSPCHQIHKFCHLWSAYQ